MKKYQAVAAELRGFLKREGLSAEEVKAFMASLKDMDIEYDFALARADESLDPVRKTLFKLMLRSVILGGMTDKADRKARQIAQEYASNRGYSEASVLAFAEQMMTDARYGVWASLASNGYEPAALKLMSDLGEAYRASRGMR